MSEIEKTCQYPGLPESYKRMVERWQHAPSESPELKGAMDIMFIAVSMCGGPAWTDRHLGEALAWGLLSGFMEVCCLNKALWCVLMMASYRFGIRGGSMPEIELMDEWLSTRVRELWEKGDDTEWLPAFFKRYNIIKPKSYSYREWYPVLPPIWAKEEMIQLISGPVRKRLPIPNR